MTLLAEAMEAAAAAEPVEFSGRVVEVRGLSVRAVGLSLPVGALVRIVTRGAPVLGEVIGFGADHATIMVLGDTAGLGRDDRVVALEAQASARVGDGLIGRVVDGLGRPIDGRGPIRGLPTRPLRPPSLPVMSRPPIDAALATGVRAIDAMLTIGRGQRLGVVSPAGLGKSTLLGMIARGGEADVSIIALIGERGREVRQFVEQTLGATRLARSVVVAAPSDAPATMRLRAAMFAHSAAEHFRDRGLHVLLLMDSLTRFAQAQRQVALAAGEPPALRGYPPSVFAALPALVERTGHFGRGSITGIYALLAEGDDLAEPVTDACRGLLDGQIVLSRDLAERGHWPAIDLTASVSRLAPHVTDEPHRLARAEVAKLFQAGQKARQLQEIGAYARGADPLFDLAADLQPRIDALLRQGVDERTTFAEARAGLLGVALEAAKLAVHR